MDWGPASVPESLGGGGNLLLEELSFSKDLKTVPPGMLSGMNFGAADVNLSLAAALKPKSRKEETAEVIADRQPEENVVDLADMLRQQGTIFDWIAEEEPASTAKKSSRVSPERSSTVFIQPMLT